MRTPFFRLSASLFLAAFAIPFLGVFLFPPSVVALEICEDPIRNFPGGPGRRPGATVVPVFLRQTVKNERGEFVFAISEKQLAEVNGDTVEFRVQVKNDSPFPVGAVEIHHAYRTVREGPKLLSVEDVTGGAYVPDDHMFVIERIEAGETIDLEYTLFLNRPLGSEISQSAVTLHDFTVLDPGSRFPQRYPETSVSLHRTTIDEVGIGGKEVSCFTAEDADRFALPGQQQTNSPSRGSINPSNVQTPVAASALTPEQIRGNLIVQIRSTAARPMAGDSVTYTVTVRNDTAATFHEILVDSRFDASLLDIRNDGGGTASPAGIAWMIDVLDPGETWSATYTVRIDDRMQAGDSVPSTVTLFGEELLDVPTNALRDTSDLVIAAEEVMLPSAPENSFTVLMPETGAEVMGAFAMLLHIVIGIVIAVSFYGTGVWMVWRRLE